MKPLLFGRGEGRVGAGGGGWAGVLCSCSPWEDEVPQECCESLVGDKLR
jgi:hypothetical protein